ncbi:MAG: Carboxypeptidase regulatory-like domain [Actinomycetota bacterium]|jgi:hypothetical protein|nr:Carboxypeptidase regulatory-like domain [Actinomycetota bacterium]
MRRGARTTVVALVVMVAGLAGCGSPTPAAPTPSTSSTSVIPTTSATTATTATSVPSDTVGFSDDDRGRSVTVGLGQRVTVILHSADFVFAAPADPSVLRDDGPPTVTPGAVSCVEEPGSGCGVVVASFLAAGPGDADLTAARTRCVEPRCLPADAQWTLHVHVEPPTASAGPTTTTIAALGSESEVRGTVRFSPVCPVERIPPDPACAPRPGAADVELVRADGTVAANATAGEDGDFAVPVPPGTYTVRASVPGRSIGGGCQTDPAEVTVAPASSATVAVTCDTGIR